jgi:hypothetical protein
MRDSLPIVREVDPDCPWHGFGMPVSTQPISDERLAEIERTHRHATATRSTETDSWLNGYQTDVRDLLAALVAVRAERDRLILAIRSHAPKQADAIIDVAAVSSPGEETP